MLIARPRSPSPNHAITARPLEPLTLPPEGRARTSRRRASRSSGRAAAGVAKRAIATSIAAVEKEAGQQDRTIAPLVGEKAPRQFGQRDAQPQRAEHDAQMPIAQMVGAAHPDGGGRKAGRGADTLAFAATPTPSTFQRCPPWSADVCFRVRYERSRHSSILKI